MYREQRRLVFQCLFPWAVNYYYFSRGKIIWERWQSLVECTGLENRSALTGTVGSNPTLSVRRTKRGGRAGVAGNDPEEHEGRDAVTPEGHSPKGERSEPSHPLRCFVS